MDMMTSFLARKGEKYLKESNLQEKELKTYIVRKRKHIKGAIYRSQNRHLRPFYHAGTIKLEFEDKLSILKEIYNLYGEGEYIILHFPPRRKGRNKFSLFWQGRLPTEELLENMEEKEDEY